MRNPTIFSLLVTVLAGNSLLTAQENLIGKTVPEVTAYDSGGNPFPLREQLKGHYSVIVFGCLT